MEILPLQPLSYSLSWETFNFFLYPKQKIHLKGNLDNIKMNINKKFQCWFAVT